MARQGGVEATQSPCFVVNADARTSPVRWATSNSSACSPTHLIGYSNGFVNDAFTSRASLTWYGPPLATSRDTRASQRYVRDVTQCIPAHITRRPRPRPVECLARITLGDQASLDSNARSSAYDHRPHPASRSALAVMTGPAYWQSSRGTTYNRPTLVAAATKTEFRNVENVLRMAAASSPT